MSDATIYFVAGERSGDNHGAALLKALRARAPKMQFLGRGGPKMRTIAGGKFLDWIDDTAVVGLWEVIRRYPFFRKQFQATISEIDAAQPSAVVLIDYPGFNLRLARALRAKLSELKIIYYISPQVWAWNRRRVSQMAPSIDLMLCIFPFEPDLYKESGLRAIFVGHPMTSVIPSENATPAWSEGSRRHSFKVTQRDPSTPLRYAQDDGEEISLRAAEEPSDRMPNGAGKMPALPARSANGAIQIHGAREHNLKNIDVAIPRDQMVVITGLSGSGKSTLAFDILFAEGQRRFLDSMSPYARQFVEQLEKPDVDLVEGLPPSVAIEQRVTCGGGKSTVATVTEVYHFLRLLFAKTGTQFCPDCNLPVEKQTLAAIVKQVETAAGRGPLKVLAPLVKARKGFHRCRALGGAQWIRHPFRRRTVRFGGAVSQT
jgi:hypothetical protein